MVEPETNELHRLRRVSLAVTCAAAALGCLGVVYGPGASPSATSAARPAPSSPPPAYEDATPFARDVVADEPLLPGEEPRRVLALYDSSELVENGDQAAGAPAQLPVSTETALAHRLAELPLWHLGVALDFLDVNTESLPPHATMARYRGVLSWFGDNRMRHPDAYLRWLVDEAHAGRRVVVMENLGAFEDLTGHAVPAALVDELVSALGAHWVGEESSDSSEIRVADADRGMIGFEAPLPEKFDYYAELHALAGTHVYLKLARAGDAASTSDVVWTSAHGGFALPTLVWREDRVADRWVTRWLVDPVRFFTAALALDGLPRVDVTTLEGSRIFYSQIDGDGMDTISEVDFASRCGELVRDRIFKRYDLPFTASVVVGYTAPPPLGKGSVADVAVARSIFALPNVEVGSHGFAHPLNWRARDGEVSVAGLPGYIMSGESEIARSVEYIDHELAPAGKPCRIMLWTGDCNPTAEQLAVAYRLGLRNMNGGDPRMDAHFPSYAHLVPPIHRVGGLAQYYTSAANDYILTDEWKPPYYRFRNVLQTFARSGAPRRIVPIDVYFHFYSARNVTALTALEEVFDWVATQPVAPLFASEYVDIVRDASLARIVRSGSGAWTVKKGPSLRTVRFDELVHVDVARSRGVVGYLQDAALRATYVHLDGSRESTVVLAAAPPAVPYLVRASHFVDDAALSPATLAWTTHGPGRRTFVFGGLTPGARYRWQPAGEALVDGDGRLTVAVPGGPEKVRLVASRVSP